MLLIQSIAIELDLLLLIPVCRGGVGDKSNLGVAHASCNLSKRALTIDEWYKSELFKEVFNK